MNGNKSEIERTLKSNLLKKERKKFLIKQRPQRHEQTRKNGTKQEKKLMAEKRKKERKWFFE